MQVTCQRKFWIALISNHIYSTVVRGGVGERGGEETKLLLIQREEMKVNLSHKIGLTRRQNCSEI